MTITPHQVENATTWKERPGGFSPETIADVLNAAIRAGLVFDSAPLDGDRQYQVVTKATAQRLTRVMPDGSWTDIINAVLDDRERLQAAMPEPRTGEIPDPDTVPRVFAASGVMVETVNGWLLVELQPADTGDRQQVSWKGDAGVAVNLDAITVDTPPTDQGVTYTGGVLLDGGRTKDGWGWTGKEWVRDDSAPVDHSNDPEIVELQVAEAHDLVADAMADLDSQLDSQLDMVCEALRKVKDLGELQASDSKVMFDGLSVLADLRGIVERNGKILGDDHLDLQALAAELVAVRDHLAREISDLQARVSSQRDATREVDLAARREYLALGDRVAKIELRLRRPEPGEGGFVGSGGAWGGPTITDQYGRIWPVVGGSVGYSNGGGGGGGSNHWQSWTAGGPTPGDTTGDEHPGVS